MTDDALSRLVSRFDSGRFAEDRVIVQEGDTGDKFYLIVRGKLEVYRTAEHGIRNRLEILSDGDFFR